MTQLNKIDENQDLFEHKTKIRTYLKKLDENWKQKVILTKNLRCYVYFEAQQNHYNFILKI